MNSVRIRVPATTANLGPGYDCLGVALRLSNVVEVRRGARPVAHPMADEAADAFFRASGLRPFRFGWSIAGEVPVSRGLGSSVTLRLGLLHALDALSGSPLGRERLFELCADLEGHPDNAAPAAFGGFNVAGPSGARIRFPVAARLRFVLLIPEREVRTSAARKVLPATLPHRDAARSLGNACVITAAFASGDYRALRGAFEDALHQPFRTPLLPELPRVIEAGTRAGALGGFLSGSGSTIACVTLSNAERVASAMAAAWGPDPARTLLTEADNRGARPLR